MFFKPLPVCPIVVKAIRFFRWTLKISSARELFLYAITKLCTQRQHFLDAAFMAEVPLLPIKVIHHLIPNGANFPCLLAWSSDHRAPAGEKGSNPDHSMNRHIEQEESN